jgi:hypothetical protein
MARRECLIDGGDIPKMRSAINHPAGTDWNKGKRYRHVSPDYVSLARGQGESPHCIADNCKARAPHPTGT